MNQLLTDYLENIIEQMQAEPLHSFIISNTAPMPNTYLSILNDENDYNDSDENEDEAYDELDYPDTFNNLVEDKNKETVQTQKKATEVIDKERQLIILGNPGSGKTTLAKYLLYTLAQQRLQQNSGDIPIYIPLKELTTTETLENLINKYEHSIEFYEQIKTGKVVWLLDGLNEIPPMLYKQTLSTITYLVNTYPQTGIIVTSRLYGYNGQLSLPAYQLNEFTDEDIRSYILQQTGDETLYRQLTANPTIHSLTTNPLLLTMIVQTSHKTGTLPTLRCQLYEKFIQFQLNKSGIIKDKERQTVLKTLSFLAFSMRKYGFLSDSYSGLEAIISEWIAPDQTSHITRQLMRSGLLSFTCKQNNFWSISFIHETFQEYFTAQYIFKQFLDYQELCVNLTGPEWRETLSLLCETLSAYNDNYLTNIFLQLIAKQYASNSETPYFNDKLKIFFKQFASILQVNPFIREWLLQYLWQHIQNFLQLPTEQKTPARFNNLLTATFTADVTSLCMVYFQSFRWIEYWLYTPEDSAFNMTKANSKLLKTIAYFLQNISCKSEAYIQLDKIQKDFDCIQAINIRIIRLKHVLFSNMSLQDYQKLYDATGHIDALLMTLDANYIEQELAGKDNLQFDYLELLPKDLNRDLTFSLYGTLFTRMTSQNQETLLATRFLTNHLYNTAGLDEFLLKAPYMASYKIEILKACYMIPADRLSEYYFKQQKRLLNENIKHELENTQQYTVCEHLYKDRKKFNYLLAKHNELQSEDTPSFLMLKKLYPDLHLHTMQLNYFKVLDVIPDESEEKFTWLEPNYKAGEEVFPSWLDNEDEKKHLLLLYAYKTKYTKKNLPHPAILLNGIKYKLEFWKKMSSKLLVTKWTINENKIRIIQSIDQIPNKLLKEKHYLFRPELMTPSQIEYLTQQNPSLQFDTGTFAKCLTQEECNDNCVAVVVNCNPNNILIQYRNSSQTLLLPQRFEELKENDIVYISENNYASRIDDKTLLTTSILSKGTVHIRHGKNKFIRTKQDTNNLDYYFYDKDNEFNVGDNALFFPTISQVTSRHGKAYAVQKQMPNLD